MAADQQGAAAAAVPAEPVPVFALSPALVGQGFLDWTKHGNSKLHQSAIEKLIIKFEGKADQILLLVGNEMTNKANQMGFDRTIMHIPDENGIFKQESNQGTRTAIVPSHRNVGNNQCHWTTHQSSPRQFNDVSVLIQHGQRNSQEEAYSQDEYIHDQQRADCSNVLQGNYFHSL